MLGSATRRVYPHPLAMPTTSPRTRQPLALRPLAQLDVSAASGLVLQDDALWVIADDELVLARYDRAGRRSGEITLLAGTLPEAAAARKAQKPDFEALLALPDRTLLALGSGSTPARRRAAWVRPADGSSRVVDLTPLYGRLERDLPELNIEGGAVLGDALFLCSRGNGSRHQNALVQLDWPACARAIAEEGVIAAEALRAISPVQLGELAGQPLGLTDLAVVADKLLFAAAAEASNSTYADGECMGSVVGLLSARGEVQDLVALAERHKVEGVWATPDQDAFELLLVADPDDRSLRAPLMAARYRPAFLGR